MLRSFAISSFILFILSLLCSCQTSVENPNLPQMESTGKSTIEALYTDKSGRRLLAVYDNLENTVTLSWAGQTQRLPLVISASGAKFSNGVFTFWNKGTTALYQKNGSILFQGVENPCLFRNIL